jgi:aspartyl-tRNA(Asn)/glutamyl-tRNA(Gln) amidotransferase subunit B
VADESILAKYQVTVGLECHVQLATDSKLFSGADNDERDKSPNSAVSPIDYALPGMLPVLNRKAVDLAIIAAKALNSQVNLVSRFDRKHYFYPDLPKGYQITQMYHPTIGPGVVHVPMDGGSTFDVRINHAHLEEDAGKLTHSGNHSLVDLNRAGTPLIEIVSEPDIHSAAEAKAYAYELYNLMTYAGVTRGDLYHGNMRFDVNVSIAPLGSAELGVRAEMKNLNSFRSVERAVEFEYRRQAEILEHGDKVIQETRGWDETRQKTYTQRSKENAQDYRYMPDADIPPIILSSEEVERIQSHSPRLPNEWREILRRFDLDFAQIETLISAENEFRGRVDMLENLEKMSADQKKAKHFANWLVNVFVPLLRDESFVLGPIDYFGLQESIYELVAQNKLSSTKAKLIFRELSIGDLVPEIEAYAVERGYLQQSDDDTISGIVEEVLSDPAFEQAVNDLRNGSDKVIGFLVGQVMRKSGGNIDPTKTQEIIKRKLGV